MKKTILFTLAIILTVWLVVSYLIGCNIVPGLVPNPKITSCKCVGVIINPKLEGNGWMIIDATRVERCLGFIIWRKTTIPSSPE